MTISIDTNVIAAVWNKNHAQNSVASRALGDLIAQENLVVSGPVYSELMAGPLRTEEALDLFFHDTGIQVDWVMDESIWREAGRAYTGYVRRRTRSRGGESRRILTDFLIGAHALSRGNSMLTLDKELYRVSFPTLQIHSV